MKVLVVQSCPTLCEAWTIAHQAPLSMGFSRQGYWSGLSFVSPGDLPDPGIEPRSPASQADSLPFEPLGKPPVEERNTIQSFKIKRHKCWLTRNSPFALLSILTLLFSEISVSSLKIQKKSPEDIGKPLFPLPLPISHTGCIL